MVTFKAVKELLKQCEGITHMIVIPVYLDDDFDDLEVYSSDTLPQSAVLELLTLAWEIVAETKQDDTEDATKRKRRPQGVK